MEIVSQALKEIIESGKTSWIFSVALILNNSIPQITQKYPITNGQEAVFQDSKTNMEITQLNKKSFAWIAFGLSISKFVRGFYV